MRRRPSNTSCKLTPGGGLRFRARGSCWQPCPCSQECSLRCATHLGTRAGALTDTAPWPP
eukprot:5163773-Lingulodinium_polyedra.AAC.1